MLDDHIELTREERYIILNEYILEGKTPDFPPVGYAEALIKEFGLEKLRTPTPEVLIQMDDFKLNYFNIPTHKDEYD